MKKIKTALLSYGMSGKVFHAPFLDLHPGFQLIGACERSKKNIQNDYPYTKTYDCIDDLLADDIDLVIVNTPVETHYEFAKKALLSGKNIIVEKAFTTTVAEAEDLKKIAVEQNKKIAVFHNRRWDSDFKTVKHILNRDMLGEIVEAEIHFDRYNPNLSIKIHKETNNPGAGILKDLGSHIIDQALCLFGFPEAVFADIRVTRENSVVDDCVDLILFYPKIRVRLKAGFFVREALPSYIIHGKKGSFLKSRGDVQEDELKLGRKPNNQDWGTEPEYKSGIIHTEINSVVLREKVPAFHGNYMDFFDEMYHAIIDDKIEPVTADDGIAVMKIIEAAIESNQLKKLIEF
ncbi:Gfo/Idh/MocA family oxidoreductase [Flavobacterium sp. NST-5]|uniref:Gfo/Idh/MocA family oxidoreductase n=1 Tax=Flavobacterium ichthyis TaxID=2698827 RepID=A0ABW9Z8T2_9FLAO|nr:Gfo/Idh/MocA family oxidoreductase [Flavobacterium ichthyis]NBL64987.1 Gfo/Idh/MocA family oxidoreductase [Flavobacterium ichthyis]